MGLVVHVDEELLAVQNVGGVVLLGVVCHEPVNQTQRDHGGALEELHDLLSVRVLSVEALEAADNQLLLTMNLTAAGLRIRINLNYRRGCEDLHFRSVCLRGKLLRPAFERTRKTTDPE